MYQIVFLPHFRGQLKHLLKKYRTLKDDTIASLESFSTEQHPHVGRNVYKVRLKSKSIQKGKSKSFRLIVLVAELDALLIPITIYFKGDKTDITLKEINHHLDIILFELRAQELLR